MAKSSKNTMRMIGNWAFLIAVIVAFVLGFGLFGGLTEGIVYILVIIGLIAGFLNVGHDESGPFLMSGTVLIIASQFGKSAMETVSQLSGVLEALLAIFVPAVIVVAVKNVFSLAKN
ncbi:MAG: hypothetical protein QXI33_00490 [Candidatus Pacearchaeota archaeon]